MNEEERKELARRIAVMQAALNGREIERRYRDREKYSDDWEVDDHPLFEWWLCEYRVKLDGFEAWADVSGWTIGKEQVRIGDHCVNIDAAKAIWYAAVKAENDKRKAKELSW